jgi:hypothetical protein
MSAITKGGDNGNLRNNLESGPYLRGQKGRVDTITPMIWAGLGTCTLGLGLVVYSTYRDIVGWDKKAPQEFTTPHGAQEELAPVANKFTLVYEGQKEPKCVGDIEKVIPQKNANGEFTGLNIICKPEVTEPAK